MIIAVDFDGILCEDQFPKIGPPNCEMILFIRELIDAGHEVILWTSRVNQPLARAVAWCENWGLHFSAVNSGSPSNLAKFITDPRKIYADIYIDDHDPMFMLWDKYEGKDAATHKTIFNVRRLLKWNEEN